MALNQLETTIDSSKRTAVRVTIATARYLERKQELYSSGCKKSISSMVLINNGDSTTIGGCGEMYDNFLKTKELKCFHENEGDFTSYLDPHYASAKLKVMKFDESYDNMPYDASTRKWLLAYNVTIFQL